jgi:hypothetical protein
MAASLGAGFALGVQQAPGSVFTKEEVITATVSGE